MTDVLTPEQRKLNMSRIKNKNTKPEMVVRSLLHKLGFRFRVHYTELPGKPDIVFTKRKIVIFIHGCYWHMHDCKYGTVVPKTNADFWQSKRMSNVLRDNKNKSLLEQADWKVVVIWECETKQIEVLEQHIKYLLNTSI